ncbi:hypothetical protein GF354_05625 [Candidatus Peregrinibacteria bacterium]|nr:hypothetical protein [Candidatus Peregrinibacteria bacterium]
MADNTPQNTPTPEQKDDLLNPLDVNAGEDKKDSGESGVELVKNIVSTETTDEEKLLQEAPEVDTTLLKGVTPEKSVLLLFLKILFGVLLALSIASFFFFTSQLEDTFDLVTDTFDLPHAKNELALTNEEIKSLQTDYNYYRYIQANAYLNEFSYFGDTFVQNFEILNSQTASSDDKSEAEEAMKEVRNSIREAFMNAVTKLSPDLVAPLIDPMVPTEEDLKILFINELRTKIQDQIELLSQGDDEEAQRDAKNLTQTNTLVGKDSLIGLLKNTDFDALSDKELYDLIQSVNELILNDMSLVQDIKSQRIKWSDVINEIERRTVAVDSYYNQNFFDEIGGVRYSSYDFDTERRLISISGEIKRFDTANFTMIANLMEEFNRSEMFEGAEMRSFSKSGSLETGYNSSLSFSLQLIENATSNQIEE